MEETARGGAASASAARSSVFVAAVLGAAAGALGFPVTAAEQFDRLPALFPVGIVLGIGLVLVARTTGRNGVLLVTALMWVLASSALILVIVKPNGDLTRILAVTSNVAPSGERLASGLWLGLFSGVIAATSLIVAGLVASPATDGDTESGAR